MEPLLEVSLILAVSSLEPLALVAIQRLQFWGMYPEVAEEQAS